MQKNTKGHGWLCSGSQACRLCEVVGQASDDQRTESAARQSEQARQAHHDAHGNSSLLQHQAEVALQHRHQKAVGRLGGKVVRKTGQGEPPERANRRDLAQRLAAANHRACLAFAHSAPTKHDRSGTPGSNRDGFVGRLGCSSNVNRCKVITVAGPKLSLHH